MNEIRIGNGLFPESRIGTDGPAGLGSKAGGPKFGEILGKAVDEVNKLQAQADHAAEGLITGRDTNIHGTLVALEKADVSFKLMMKVRDKIVDAYREVMKMGV